MASVAAAVTANESSANQDLNDISLKLPQLQNLCKRDPASHKDDYDAQVRRLRSECGILRLSPNSPSGVIVELIQFVAAVSSSSYKGKESDKIVNILINLLIGGNGIINDDSTEERGESTDYAQESEVLVNQYVQDMDFSSTNNATQNLHKEVRKSCVSALILMRNKGVVKPMLLLRLFFKVMSTVQDKGLRLQLNAHIVNDIRNINKKGKRDDKLNRTFQTFLHKVIVHLNNNHDNSTQKIQQNSQEEGIGDGMAARKAVEICIDLYRRNVWNNDKSIKILESACYSPITNVMTRAIRFFLNIEDKMEYDRRESEEEMYTRSQQIDFHLHSRKTNKRKNQVQKKVKFRQKVQMKRDMQDLMEGQEEIFLTSHDKGVHHAKKLYPAIELITNPQGLAEFLLKKIKGSNSTGCNFKVKVLLLNFVTRLVGNHELLLLPLYPLLQRYMGGHQKDVTLILAYTVQACHEYVPPEEIYGILKTIAHNFVTERCSGEQMAVGINAVRAICSRVPSVLSSDDSLENTATETTGAASSDSTTTSSAHLDVEAFARDLAAYAKHRDRSVAIAGKTWLNFVREVYPSLLQGKDRGMVGSALHRSGEKPLKFGEQNVAAGVKGADLLLEYEEKKRKAKEARQKKKQQDKEDSDDGIEEVPMNDVEEEEESEDEEAPDLVMLPESSENEKDLKSMSESERKEYLQKASSTRIFSTDDFIKMRKLVAREEKIRRDPRAAARLKREQQQESSKNKFDEISDDDSEGDEDSVDAYSDESDSDSDEETDIHTKGKVNPMDIMAMSKKKRMNKEERLKKVLAGRSKFEQKTRAGGTTDSEKKRNKSFVMTKFSSHTRMKQGLKETARNALRGGIGKKNGKKRQGQHTLKGSKDAKKRRRRF